MPQFEAQHGTATVKTTRAPAKLASLQPPTSARTDNLCFPRFDSVRVSSNSHSLHNRRRYAGRCYE